VNADDCVEVPSSRVRQHARIAATYGAVVVVVAAVLAVVWLNVLVEPAARLAEGAEADRAWILDPATTNAELRRHALASRECVVDLSGVFVTLSWTFFVLQACGAVGYLILHRRLRADLAARPG